MNGSRDRTSRRAFFLQGGAVVGAGVVSAGTALAGTEPVGGSVEPDLHAADREAIRQVQAAFAASIEAREWANAIALFAPGAHLQLGSGEAKGVPAIRQLFMEKYAGQRADTLHDAYRPNALQLQDSISVAAGGHARAIWHVDVRVVRPLQGDCTIAQMARLQGQLGDLRWESGLLEVRYVLQEGRWLIEALDYRTG